MNAKSSRAHTIFKLMVEKRASLDSGTFWVVSWDTPEMELKTGLLIWSLYKLNGIHDAIPGILTDPCKATPSRNKGLKKP